MRLILGSLICVGLAALAAAQTPAAGLLPDWDIRPILEEMSAHAGRVGDMLTQVDAKAWVEKGASDTYAAQVESSKAQARAIVDGAKALAKNPEKLSASLELYFRIAGLDDMVRSIEEGIRQYQDPKLAQELTALAAENLPNRDRFRTYITNLATQREQECEIMDREAQRCRGVLATQPPPAAPASTPAGGASAGKK